MEEDKESVEFYKIKLMEKESELKTLEAKFKKIEFKHSRDLKEVKMGEERAKQNLKKEKAKLDKIVKESKEHQEQNNLLQHRLTELKEEKDKQIESTRNKYNAIKEQVRSYERILPTHTFLTEIGAEIDQLPTYEDVFNNLKDKTISYDELQERYNSAQEASSEKIAALQKNQEECNIKLGEKQRAVKEMVPKIVDLEGQITEYKSQLQEAASKILDGDEQMQGLRGKIQELEEETKQLKLEIDEMGSFHNQDLLNKEQEIKELTEEEFRRYEEEINELHSRSEAKEQSFMQQINVYEEQVNQLQARLTKEKERFEENYRELQQAVSNLKIDAEADRKTVSQLEVKNTEHLKNLAASGKQVQVLEKQLFEVKKEHEATLQKLKEESEQRNQQSTELEEKDEEKKSLEIKLEDLILEMNKMAEESKFKQEENLQLMSEVDQLKSRIENGNSSESSGRLSIPTNFSAEVDIVRRRKSTILESDNPLVFVESTETQGQSNHSPQEAVEFEKQSRERLNSMASEHKDEIEKLENKILSLQKAVQLKSQQVSLLENNMKVTSDDFIELEKKYRQQTLDREQLNTKIKALDEQLASKEKKITTLSHSIEDFQTSEATNKKKLEAQRSTIEALTQQLASVKVQLKKEKETKQALSQQIKEMKNRKAEESQNADKSTRELNQRVNDLNSKLTLQEKRTQELNSVEKSLKKQIETLKFQLEKLAKDLQAKEEDVRQKETQVQEQKNTLKEKSKNIEKMANEIKLLEEENIAKDRQIELINASLSRERKQRTLITVPSLKSLQNDQEEVEEENFKEHYNTLGQKEGQIYMLEREVENLKQEIEELKASHRVKVDDMEAEQNEYIQEIISMKLKVANSEMHAAEKEHLYNQLKKKMRIMESASPKASSTTGSGSKIAK